MKDTALMVKLFSAHISQAFKDNFADAIEKAKKFGTAEFDNEGKKVCLTESDGNVLADQDGEVTEIATVEDSNTHTYSFKMRAFTDTNVPADNIKDELDGTNMNPEERTEPDQGIVDNEKAGLKPGDANFSETENDVPEGEVEVVQTDEKCNKFSIRTKDFSVNFEGTLENACKLAKKFGMINIKLMSETEIPEDDIKDELDGTNMNPEEKTEPDKGIVDKDKAGFEPGDANFSMTKNDDGTVTFSLGTMKLVAEGSDAQIASIAKLFADAAAEESEEEESSEEKKEDDIEVTPEDKPEEGNLKDAIEKMDKDVDALEAKGDEATEEEATQLQSTAEEIVSKLDEVPDTIEGAEELKAECKNYCVRIANVLDKIQSNKAQVKVYSDFGILNVTPTEKKEDENNVRVFSQGVDDKSPLKGLSYCLFN